MKRFIYLAIVSILFAASIFSCKNPMIGLGPGADLETPSGSFSLYENGDYVRGVISLEGISSDDVEIESVTAVLDKAVLSAELTDGVITYWKMPIDTTNYADGEYTIILNITDTSGRVTEKRLLLYFDNTAPTVLVTSSAGITSGAATNYPVIRGEAYDYLFSRINKLEAEVVSGNAEILSLQGSNGWTITLQTTGTGIYSVAVTAYDKAGNSNQWLYHSSDLPTDTKIEDIANAEKTGDLEGESLSLLRRTSQDVEVDLSLDEPQIVVSNPEEGKAAADNILGGTASAVGYIEDDDEVDTDTVQLSLDGGSSWQQLTIDDGQLSGSGGFIRWSYNLSSLANGVYSLQVKADDTGKSAGDSIVTGYSVPVPFTIDKTAPSVTITSPEPGTYLGTGSFPVEGTASDTGGSINSVRISINGADFEDVPITTGENVTYSYDVTDTESGAVSIKVEAVDDSGKTSFYSQQIYVDTEEPTVEFLSPSAGLYINGTAVLQGVSSDNWSLQQVKVQIGGLVWDKDVADPLAPSEFYSWQMDLVSSNYENSGMAVEVNGSGIPEVGTGIWELKIWAEAEDRAGNITLREHKIYIDNSLDRPGVNISSPSDGSVMAGSVILSGSAWDDGNEAGEALDHVEIRVWKGRDDGSDGHVFVDSFDLSSLLGLEDVYGDDSWYKVEGTSIWQTELNADGEFYPGSGHDGTVKIDVRAVDQKSSIADLAGNMESIEVTFDDTVPYFSNLSHSSGDYENGTFNLTGYVNDDDSVERLRISYNGGVDWTSIPTTPGASGTPDFFEQSIDTVDKIGNSGILYLRLEALDTANYKTIAGINLNVDNLLPSGSYTAPLADLSETALVQGTAVDTGTISGVDRIEVGFTIDGIPVNPLNSKGERNPIIINSRSEVGDDLSVNGDNDGFNESMSLSGSTWTWWAEFDTTSFDDGVLEVTYTVYDNAQNEYSQTVGGDGVGNIKNHAPEITSIVAGWDQDHDGSVEAGESNAYSVDTTENNSVFGSLSYLFNTDYDGQNGVLVYGIRIRPLPAGSWTDMASVTSSGTLDTTSNSVFSAGDGDYEIEFSVVDEKNYESILTVQLTVENSDSEDPVMSFYELTDTDASAVKTNNIGHIEIDGSIYLSGKIPFSGQAEDNQRIESISIQINGGAAVAIAEWDDTDKRLEYNDGNTPLETGSGFIDDSGRLKHRANWIYEWDSAALPTGLGTNIRFIVEDAAGRTHFQEHTYDVVPYISSIDTMLSASYSDSLARSAKGRYPVLIESGITTPTYETVTVNGWNIDSSAAGSTSVRLSNDTDALDDDDSTLQGTDLETSGKGDDSGAIFVELDAAGSGYLTVLVDGVASRNNINENTEPYNLEDSDVHQSLSDDRYISLWDITRIWRTIDLADHAVYPSMTMNNDIPNFAYVNNSMGYGQAFYYDGTDNKQFIENWDLFTYTSIDLNDSGKQGALVDLNIVNGNYGDYNAGNYGGIFVNFFYDVPYYNWKNYTFRDNGVWLDNLVDDSGATTAVLNRYQYPDILLDGPDTATDVFYSVYDTLEQRLVFRHFMVGTDIAVDTGTGGRINDEGTALYTSVNQQNRSSSWPNYNNNNNSRDSRRFDYVNTSQPGTTPDGAQYVSETSGSFSAVGATSGGSVAVLAYYDTSGSGELVFRYNTTPDEPGTDNAGTWSAPVIIDQFVDAQYIDLKVDAYEHIHIAYYDSFHGDVKYAYIPAYNSAAGAVQLYTVDSYLIIGSKLTLDLSSAGSPYLSYKGLGNTARAAWLTGAAANGVTDDEFTGSWEVQTVPELVSDSDSNRFNIGVDSAGLPVVGYTEDGLEYVRLLPELSN